MQEADILNSEGELALQNQLSSDLTAKNFLPVLADKSAAVYCLFYTKL